MQLNSFYRHEPQARSALPPERRIPLLQSTVTDFNLCELLQEIRASVENSEGLTIAHHNLHSLYLFHSRPAFRAFYDNVVAAAPIDGMPVIWIARLYGRKISRDRRLTYVDFLPHLMQIAEEERWRMFYLGSPPKVCEDGARAIAALYPGINLQAAHGYFDITQHGTENQEILKRIRGFKPNVLLVGMGMPRQEEWIATNRDALQAGVILPCGAAIDYMAGAIPTPPRWAGHMGLEWLFRLCAEPRRLAYRYLVEPWFLLYILLIDLRRESKCRHCNSDRVTRLK